MAGREDLPPLGADRRGVAGLLSTFLALWVATLITDGLSFDGVAAWILATVVVWLTTALLGWLAVRYLLTERRAEQKH